MGMSRRVIMSTIIELAPHRQPSPMSQNGKATPPRRRKNEAVRPREYLTAAEVARLQSVARKSGRHGQRDKTLVMMMFRHALRVSEVTALRWDQIDWEDGLLSVTRLKKGRPSRQPLRGPELRELRQLRRDWPESPYLFCSERAGSMTAANVRKVIARLGRAAGLPFPIHPHMLRHSLGHYLVNRGEDTRAIQDYLGHRNVRHTIAYTQLSPERYKTFFTD
jgi:type 1 fimbriae regulatory protein FimE